MPETTCVNKSFMAFHIAMPKRIDIIDEKIRDFAIEKFIILRALTNIIVRPEKNENQLEMVLGFSKGSGDDFFSVQSRNLLFIISANINPDIKHMNKPHESQKIGSSMGFIC